MPTTGYPRWTSGQGGAQSGLAALLFLCLCLTGSAAAHDKAHHAKQIVSETEGVRYDVPKPGSYRLPIIKPAADDTVLTEAGVEKHLFDLAGDRITLLSFIYTRCSDEKGCPLAVTVFYQIEDAMMADPVLGRRLKMISLSFDPAHDTPEVMAAYANDHTTPRPGRLAQWEFATTAGPAQLQPLLDDYGQYVVRELDETGKQTDTFSHVLKVFLIDRKHRIRNIYSVSFLYPELVLADIRTLLLEEAAAQASQ